MGADPKYTTVSGISNGGNMATTMHVTNSETFKGLALVDSYTYGM